MFKALKTSRKGNEGFSLVELLVVLLIMSVLAGIAVPLYLNQKQRSYMSLAQGDAYALGQEITAVVSDYTSFGSLAGTITIPSNVLTFGGMTSATGSGTANTTTGAGLSGPLTTTSTLRVTAGSTVTSGNWATGTTNWCIVVTNNGASAKYTNAGLTASSTGAVTACVAGA